MLNVSARAVEIYIDGMDFSPCFISGEGSDNHLDQSGLISFSGQIELGKSLYFSEVLDDRRNPKFCRGKQVIIRYADTAGTLRRHPRGALRILKASYDDEIKRLTLELGDLISLLNFKEPTDPDKADSKGCSGTTAAQVIRNLLNEAGIININIPGNLLLTKYNYPLNMGGSYLDTVGKILYANNCFGWIDKDEIFQVRKADIVGGDGGVAIVVGRNEIWYKRLDGAEAPVEKVKAVGNEIIATSGLFNVRTVTESYGSSAAVLGSSSGFMGEPNFDIVIDRTITERSYNGVSVEETITNYQPYGLVIPRNLWGSSDRLGLIVAEFSKSKSVYGGDADNGILLYKTELVKKPRGTFLSEIAGQFPDVFFDGIATPTDVLQSREDYSYNKDLVTQIQKNTSELNLAILDGTNNRWQEPFNEEYFVSSEIYNQRWSEPVKGVVQYESVTFKSTVRVPNAAIVTDETGKSNRLDLRKASSESRFSTAGQETQPAAERAPARCVTFEEQIEEIQEFVDVCASDLKPRERTFTVELLPGKSPGEIGEARAALKEIALREGRLLKGRDKGQQIATNLQDILFDWYPLIPVNCKEQDGTVQVYLSDGCSWILSTTRALWSCDGIWVGTVEGDPEIEEGVPPPGNVIKPWRESIRLTLGIGHGVNVKRYFYELSKTVLNLSFGIGHGINIFRLLPLSTGHGIDVQIQPAFDSSILVRVATGHGIDIQIQPAFDLTISVELETGHGLLVVREIVFTLATGHGIDIQIGEQQLSWKEITFSRWKTLDFESWKNIIF